MNINFNEMPSGYALCITNSCPMAAHCLRQLAMQAKVKKDKIITIVNPHLTKPSESCECYRSDQIATFAKGFSKMKEQMLKFAHDNNITLHEESEMWEPPQMQGGM